VTTLGAAQWQQVRALFDEVVELAPDRRAERLAGDTDPALRRAVELLLAGDAEADARLARLETAFGTEGADPSARAAREVDPLGLTGRTVSHFRVLEPLAVGGMGVVYRAEDTRLGRAVALKLPLPERCPGRDARERFLREGRAVGALDHPNVCAIHEVGETEEGYLFLAMTLYAGETLGARLAREGALLVPQALEIARAIARGLGAAHAAGIVHRDMKPANVMLLPDGGVKVLDFGLAKARDLSLTAPHAMMGTVSYMAPEQIRGAAADARADMWALGVVLYEMLTGRRPFDGEHDIAIAHAIVHDEPARPRTLRAGVPPAVESVVRSLLQKERERRPATAEAVETDLTAAALARASRHASWAASARWWARPARRLAGVGAVGLLLVVAAGVAARQVVRDRAGAPAVERSVAAPPTSNAQAHDYYLRGHEYERRARSEDNLRSAQSLYRRALALDSSFALARARLAITHAELFAATYDPSPARREEAQREAEAALRSQPGLAEGHLALGHALALSGDVDRALDEFRRAAAGMPNSAEPHSAIAIVLRNEGRLEEAVARFERAARLDPRDVGVLRQLAFSQSRMRRYEAGTRTWDRVIELTPDDYYARVIRGYLFIRWQGTADTLAAALRRIPPEWDPEGTAAWARFTVARIQRRPADALAALAASRHDASRDEMFYRPRALLRGQVYSGLGDDRRARAHYDIARAQLEDSLARSPNSARLRIALGLAYAGLGRRREAIGEARRAMALLPAPTVAPAGTAIMGDAAEIFVRAGDLDGALALLERLLGTPAGREVSVALLRVDPTWDPLRGDARFERLLQRFAAR